MSDAPAPHRPGDAHRHGDAGPLTAQEIDRVLAGFRGWLEAHGRTSPPERVDLPAVLNQFTALRHEVNLQTKASRSLSEQAAKVLESIESSKTVPKPVVKAFLDLADVLAVSQKQMLKLRETVEPLLEQLASESLPPRPAPGWFSRNWTQWADAVTKLDTQRSEASAAAAEILLDLAQAAADGYGMTLRRVERALPELGLEPIDCVGLPFDPETMEVVDAGGDGPAGIVADEIRRGYRANGTVIRFAQVRVPR